MGKFKRDFDDVEYKDPQEGYNGEQPRPGLYDAKLVVCEEHDGGTGDAEKTHWVFEIVGGDYEGWRGHGYTDDENSAWKEQAWLVALGIMKPNESVDTTHERILKNAKPVRIRVRNEKYEGETRAKLGSVLPPGDEPAKGSTSGGRRRRRDNDEPGGSRGRDKEEPF